MCRNQEPVCLHKIRRAEWRRLRLIFCTAVVSIRTSANKVNLAARRTLRDQQDVVLDHCILVKLPDPVIRTHPSS